MYLYKATCPEIPNPKQKNSRGQGGVGVHAQGLGQGKLIKQVSMGPGSQSYAPVMLWTTNKANNAGQLKQLEEFLNFHSLSLHDTVRSQTGMVYREFVIFVSRQHGASESFE
ncbi:hypothetical protein CRENBAI_008534 [Crenichthys baileyi]|uniref:Uncharacterized protein n=1 Tax=Crenichthys baileyi TaxID=28760 RepID=A0AAV9S576_9TELE